MSTVDKSSAPSSATTSRSEHSDRSETEFLDQQTAQAKAALAHALGDLKTNLATAVDIRLWTKQHPWAAVAAASVAGFATAAAVTPGRHERLKDKWSHVLAAVGEQKGNSSRARRRKSRRRRGPLAAVLASLLETLAVAGENYFLAAMGKNRTSEATAETQAAAGNGSAANAPE